MVKVNTVSVIVLLSFLIFPATAQERSPVINMYSLSAVDSFLINWKWITPLDYKKISEWAKVYHCTVNNDDSPIVDNTAWFISKYGSVLIFENLDNDKYFLHINFVTLDYPKKASIDALCVISLNNKPVKKLSFTDMAIQNRYVVIEVTREYIVNRTLVVEFKEYSSAGGFFGVWDVILSNNGTLPETIAIKESGTKQQLLKESPKNLVKPKK